MMTVPGGLSAACLGGGAGHRYWRIKAGSAANHWGSGSESAWENYKQISFFTSSNGSGTDLCLGKTASANWYYSEAYNPSKANDANTTTIWAGQLPGAWWSVDMGAPVEVHSAKLLGDFNVKGYFSPVELLQWSDDNSTWTTQATINTASNGNLQTFINL